MSKLTDEQVAEGLRDAVEWAKEPIIDPTLLHHEYRPRMFARLALALQEKLQAAEASGICHCNRGWVCAHGIGQGGEGTVTDAHTQYVLERAPAVQQARREAFEEAAKLTCDACAEGEPVKPRDISKIPGASVTWAHTNPEYGDHQCDAWKIRDRALAEVER